MKTISNSKKKIRTLIISQIIFIFFFSILTMNQYLTAKFEVEMIDNDGVVNQFYNTINLYTLSGFIILFFNLFLGIFWINQKKTDD